MRRVHYILALFVLTSFSALAQDFTVSVNKNPVAAGDRFKVTFTINTNASAFTPPNFDDFIVLSGPNRSQNMQWVNGAMSASISYYYILQAPQEGEYTIGVAKIKVGNKILSTEPVKIKVTKGTSVPQQNQQKQQQRAESGQDISDDLFIVLSVNKTAPYLGEQIVATYKIYTRLNIVDNDVSKLPDFNGFYSKEIDLPANSVLRNEAYNGKMYNAAVLKKVVLFPQQSGKLEIDPLELDLIVRIKDNRRPTSFFDQFFGSYKDVKYTAQSNKLTINVKPLPEKGKPKNFNGAVGDFALSASLDKQQVKTNQAINLKVSVTGKGNLHLLDNLSADFPEDFEVYDPKTTDNISVTGAGVSGKREFEYLVIPRYAGEFEIQPVSFSYFNPSQKKYVELTSGNFDITVEKGEEGAAGNVTYSSGNKKEVKLIGKDIRFIKTGEPNLHEKGNYFYGSPLFYLGLAGAPVLFLIFLFLKIRRDKYFSNTAVLKSKRATAIAKKRLSDAKKCLANNQQNKFYEEIFRAIYNYISDKLNMPVSELSKEKIEERLKDKNVQEATIAALTDTLNLCEMARFAPMSDVKEEQVYSQTVETISQLEKSIG